MKRISRVQGLSSLSLTSSSQCTSQRAASPIAARALSTTSSNSKITDTIRKKLWKGEAPGAADPYTQRPDASNSGISNRSANRGTGMPYLPRGGGKMHAVLPPLRSEALSEKQAAARDPNYIPAQTMDQLEEVMDMDTWWEQPGHWDAEQDFRGFANSERIYQGDVVEVTLRRAVVEVLALRRAGKLEKWATMGWVEGGRERMRKVLEAKIVVEDGKGSLVEGSEVLIDLIKKNSQSHYAVGSSVIAPEEAAEMVKAWDQSWHDIVLDDTAKFALRKRLFQLLGNRVPDSKLGPIRTVRDLLTLSIKPPKAKTLAEILEFKEALVGLPNVSVHDRRIGPVDREIAIGRWKVIKEELEKRELPVHLTHEETAGREVQWLEGRGAKSDKPRRR